MRSSHLGLILPEREGGKENSHGPTTLHHRPAVMRARARRFSASVRRYPLPVIALAGLAAALGLRFVSVGSDASSGILLATLVIGGTPIVVQTVRGMLRGQFASDIVASLAVAGALVTGEYLAGCVIVLMQTGGEALEDYAIRQASASLEALLARAPRVAHRRVGKAVEDVSVRDVAAGDVLLVRPGEAIPVDALVLLGTSAVDASALTGEPLPVSVRPGVEVLSGSICLDGALELRALRPSSQSQYEQIVTLVRAAEADKAPIGRLADRYAVLFTPFTLAMCVVAWLITHQAQAVVAVLVVATPCPLILATPVAIISGINRAARRGIIVKGGAAIEQVGRAKAVIFDKTGTLTQGTPTVERVVSFDGYDTGALLRLAAGLEQLSAHPMAVAVVTEARKRALTLPVATSTIEMAGQGVSGVVDGHMLDIGSPAYFVAREGMESAATDIWTSLDANEDAVALIGIDGKPVGAIIYADPIRPAAPEILQSLSELGVLETVMLTGDDRHTAEAVGTELGIATVKAELLPAHKADGVREVMSRREVVIMVGDGINDAPALATATVGIALGARGAAISAEAADIVILVDDLGRVRDTIAIGRRTLRIAHQSIWVGLGLSGVLMVLASFGAIVPTLGALLQEGIDVAVILNALRAR